MNGTSSWIEPPPRERGFGCFVKGCLILLVFAILLGLSFMAGTYYAVKYLKAEYFANYHERVPISQATVDDEEAVKARWNDFEKAARNNDAARIELSADDINALIASEPKLRGNAFVRIDDNTAHLQISMPIGEGHWLRGRYINAQCSVQSAPNGKPEEARITSIVVNGKPVGEEFLSWQYESWSFKRYVADWTSQTNLKTLQISDGKVILETTGTNKDPFSSESASPSPSATSATTTPTPTPSENE